MVICSSWTNKLKGAAKVASFFCAGIGFGLYIVLKTMLCGYGSIFI